MKILLTNHSLQHVGGTEKWTYAMAEELHGRGHEVTVYTFIKGITSDQLEEFCEVITEPAGEYDLILVNHNTCLGMVQEIVGYKIYTAHGPAHRLEMPVMGADRYVTVSREAQARWMAEGFQCEVITNGINLKEFYSTPSTFEKIPRVLSMCKSPLAGQMVKDACKMLGYPCYDVHYTDKPEWDTATLMRNADVVVGCGRTAYEALACGRQVLVFDWRRQHEGPRTDGWLRRDNIDEVRQFNCSTRCYSLHWYLNDLKQALEGYKPSSWGIEWAAENADIRHKVDQYLALIGDTDDPSVAQTGQTAEVAAGV
jgi:hypothetical protein